MPNWPQGTVAFLFTDIEGSTRLWERYPEAMPTAYTRHDAILRGAVAAHRGVVYKTIGDAFQVAFPSVPAAVAAAFAAQQELCAASWPVPEPIRVRMALHVGDVDPGADGDYRSPVLNRLGRLLGVGYGQQVLLSQAAFELARDTFPADVATRDLGERRLKDLYRPERIHQLVHPSLPSDFPPLATLDRRPNNLPLQPTPLIGRETEVAQIRELFEQQDLRLVTLTGPGGIGKTRLSLQVAAELVDIFNHGVFFVPLAALSDAAIVPSALAQALGVKEEPERSLLESIQDFAREREMLLVIDNFEQVLEGAPVVVELLKVAPGLKVLVTSRERLGLQGEREVVVPPLMLPARGLSPTLEQLTQYEAVRLFIARAQDARADFQVTNESAPAVAEICVRLDGLPLAIELAAVRVKLLTPPALLQRLEKRLATLTSGARDLPERQRTLRAAIDWSYDLLSDDERTLFRCLGIFAGGCTLETAESVANRSALPSSDTFNLVASLVDKSLLRHDADRDGQSRFTMLETIREYALGQLVSSGDEAAVRDAHAILFLQLAEEAEAYLRGPDQGAWFDRLEAEHDNLREAFRWFRQSAQWPQALFLAGALGEFWRDRGHYTEGARLLQSLLTETTDDPASIPAAVRAKVLSVAGTLAWGQGNLALATERHQQALALYEAVDDRAGAAFSLNNLGVQATHRGELDLAATLFAASLERALETADDWLIAVARMSQGIFALDAGDLERAEVLLGETVETWRHLGDRIQEATALVNLGETRLRLANDAAAEPLLDRALTLFRAAGQRPAVAHTVALLALLAQRRGDLGRATIYVIESVQIAQELGAHMTLVQGLERLAALAALRGRTEVATRLFAFTAAERARMGAAAPLSERKGHERDLAIARSALTEEMFAALWTVGRTLSLEQAVSDALTLATTLMPEVPDPSSPG